MTTPFTRTEVAQLVHRSTRCLEILLQHDVPELFPERVVAKYRDAVARLAVAAGDMAMFARCLDNAPQPDQVAQDVSRRTYRGKGKGIRKDKGTKHKRRHVRTRPLPDAASAKANREAFEARLDAVGLDTINERSE